MAIFQNLFSYFCTLCWMATIRPTKRDNQGARVRLTGDDAASYLTLHVGPGIKLRRLQKFEGENDHFHSLETTLTFRLWFKDEFDYCTNYLCYKYTHLFIYVYVNMQLSTMQMRPLADRSLGPWLKVWVEFLHYQHHRKNKDTYKT